MTDVAADVLLAIHTEDFDAPIACCGQGLRELVGARLVVLGTHGQTPRLTLAGAVQADLELRSRLH